MENYYLIDFENTHSAGLTGCAGLGEEDRIVIFFTKQSGKLDMSVIADHGDSSIRMIEIPEGKQSVDMHIASYVGYLAAGGTANERRVAVISQDTDFDNVLRFWKEKSGIRVLRADQVGRAAQLICAGTEIPGTRGRKKKAEPSAAASAAAAPEGSDGENEIAALLSEAGLEGGETEWVLTLAGANAGKEDAKHTVYEKLVAKFGQKRGLALYRLIRKAL